MKLFEPQVLIILMIMCTPVLIIVAVIALAISSSNRRQVTQVRMGAQYPPPVAVPPAWHPDPSGRHQFRYWDGVNWTASVSDNGQVTSDPI